MMTSFEKMQSILESITTHRTDGKMAGLVSISTAPNTDFCTRMRNNPRAVCSHCYAQRFYAMPMMRGKLDRNAAFYRTEELTPEDVPTLPYRDLRFESFGELGNVRQLANFATIAAKNPHCRFTIWTKRLDLIGEYLNRHDRFPDNFRIIISSPYLNEPIAAETVATYLGTLANIEGIFTVYNDGTDTNCAKKCMTCRKCYDTDGRKIIQIAEKLK